MKNTAEAKMAAGMDKLKFYKKEKVTVPIPHTNITTSQSHLVLTVRYEEANLLKLILLAYNTGTSVGHWIIQAFSQRRKDREKN